MGISVRGRRRVELLARLGLAAYLAAALVLLLTPLPAAAQGTEIASDGPLTRIIITPDLNCQVAYSGDAAFEFYAPQSEVGACGTFIATGGALYGPAQISSASFIGSLTQWTIVSQAPVSGSGTAADPYRIVTVVEAGASGLRLEQTDSYVVGSQSYRTELRLVNDAPSAVGLTVYRAADCYLQESDVGYGRVDGGAPACVIAPEAGARIEQWIPQTPGSRYFEGSYSELWAIIGAQQPLPNTCACGELLDNGAGLSWTVEIAAGGSTEIVHDTFFSPVGRGGIEQSFRESVPSPLSISLDPVVIAQSAIIAAGVIVLLPFPSALFNNTLEVHYDEVMAGVARISARLSAWTAGLLAWLRRQVAARRGSPPTAEQPTDVEPLPATTSPSGGARSDFWRTVPGMAALVVLSSVLYAFLDPTLGISVEALATLAGLTIGLAVVVLSRGVPLAMMARTRTFGLMSRALPATLLIGVGCVLLSRLANFQPGYLYGLIIAFVIVGATRDEDGRAEAITGAVILVTTLVAWGLLGVTRAGEAAGSLVDIALETALVTVVVAGFEAAVFSMLPLRFMPGAAVYAWSRRVWLVLIGVGLLGFVHVLLNPTTGYLADDTRSSFLTMVFLLGFFAVASVAFWAWFRFRPARA
jgi:hypothetical protein